MIDSSLLSPVGGLVNTAQSQASMIDCRHGDSCWRLDEHCPVRGQYIPHKGEVKGPASDYIGC